MAEIRIGVTKDVCLGYTVYRGNVKACDLEPATWIDFYDEEVNPLGYQRPFNEARSGDAARYAEEPDAFWPESILAIRDNAEVEDEDDQVRFDFRPESTGSKFGELIVDYNAQRTETLEGVDCTPMIGQEGLGESDGIPPFYSLS